MSTDGDIVADKGELVLRAVLVPHALDAPLVVVSVPRPPISNDGADASPGKESPPSIPSPVTETFLSLISSAEVFPGDEVAVTSVSSPFAGRVDLPLAIIHNSGSKAPSNMRASRLTMALESGVVTKISGSALVLGRAAGGERVGGSGMASGSEYSSVSVADLEAMDNALHDEVMEYFCQGLVPRKEDLDRILAGFRAGGFRYDVAGEAAGEPAEDGQEDTRGKSDKKSEGERTQRKGRDGKNGIDGERDGKEQALPGWGAADGDWH